MVLDPKTLNPFTDSDMAFLREAEKHIDAVLKLKHICQFQKKTELARQSVAEPVREIVWEALAEMYRKAGFNADHTLTIFTVDYTPTAPKKA
jgi:hypothetical protein